MIQDIHPHTFDNTFNPNATLQDEDYVFVFEGDALLLKQVGDTVEIPKKKDIAAIESEGVYLFSLNGQSCFWVEDTLRLEEDDFIYHEIKFLRTLAEREIDFLSGVAMHLKNWYEQHRFCGKCGHITVAKADERAMVCSACEHIAFPTISPAIIVAITSGEHILLARGVHFPEGFFSLVAGYVDVGETIEETIVREVREEIGIKISNVRYYKSQPWPFSGSVMIGFLAEADASQEINIDPKEIAEAGWYHRDSLPTYPPDRSIAGEIIDKFRKDVL